MCSPQILAAALAEAPPHDDLCTGHGHHAGAHHEHDEGARHDHGVPPHNARSTAAHHGHSAADSHSVAADHRHSATAHNGHGAATYNGHDAVDHHGYHAAAHNGRGARAPRELGARATHEHGHGAIAAEGIGRRRALRTALGAALGIAGASAAAGVVGAPRAQAQPLNLSGFTVRDLTHAVGPDFPVFNLYVRRPVQRQVMFEEIIGFNTAEWTMNEHTGTHIDVPAHSQRGLARADAIPVENLVAPLCVVRIAERAAQDNTTELHVEDLLDWERRNGRIPDGAFVAMDTGWYHRVHDPAAYLPFDPLRLALLIPGIGPDAAEFLLTERSIVGFGTDTSSLDVGTRFEPMVHRMLLRSGRYGIENLAALDTVPESGATLVVGAAKLRGGFGAPVRALAFV
ncbi:cyclase family protein [Nocardia bhagyanarayanae]|uniref:Kynurenine formamidase n=1 Tax=Nocardia bhagyanarayanae TaxID=1215925 RepID=A0A543FEC5_9NOCA|nr:cyclase family protein [Nocardia bhagyanarayanae]TQM32096.1 kynurenine formamidase [Nocardia bhagyanarayanae]